MEIVTKKEVNNDERIYIGATKLDRQKRISNHNLRFTNSKYAKINTLSKHI